MPDENQPDTTAAPIDAPAAPENPPTPQPADAPPPPEGRWVWVADTAQPSQSAQLSQPAPAPAPVPAAAPAPVADTAPAAAPGASPASAAPEKRFSKLSLVTLLAGLLVLIWPFTIICGHIARGRIRRSKGALTGGGVALLGLLLGYLGMVACVASTVSGGLWIWRTSSGIRDDIAAGRDPAEAVVSRVAPAVSKLGEPLVKGIMKSEALLPAGVREQINTALDESADQRLSLAGQWLLQQAAANGGCLPGTLDGFGKNALGSLGTQLPGGAAPAAPAQPGDAAGAALPGGMPLPASGMASALGGLDLSMFSSILTRGLAVVPGLTTALPPDTVALHYTKPLADGTVPVFLLGGETARLQPGDPRLAGLALEK
ncbi:DUF4190 domain-containing protein [Termitidicoccus mucosus]|uniref:DUF4190 domain-containing protein n=1 Tax=Termitidicoccus mucosus TaxID=1184151 RepID=A0A178IGW0_9BACT|nr:hypothetical protein AW736_14080 [Opitutaceae bacterium TSB47]